MPRSDLPFALIEVRPAAIVDVFIREARHAMDRNRLEL